MVLLVCYVCLLCFDTLRLLLSVVLFGCLCGLGVCGLGLFGLQACAAVYCGMFIGCFSLVLVLCVCLLSVWLF